MQVDQQQKLAQLIKTSQVLHDDERQAWLAMLPVMNDKQASDLFGILNTPLTKKSIQFEPDTDKDQKQPSLRHIANLPTEMAYHMDSGSRPSQPVAVKRGPVERPTAPRQTAPRPVAPHPDMAQVIKQRLEEKELPPSHEPAPLKLSAQMDSTPQSAVRQSQSVSSNEDAEIQTMRRKIVEPKSGRPVPVPQPQQQTNEYIPLDQLLQERKDRADVREASRVAVEAKTSERNPSADPAQELKKIDDVSACSLGTLRNQGFKSLNDQFITLVRKHGYYAVMLRFEQSPLYKQYLEAGKAWLSSNSTDSPPNVFSKAEFEKVTDFLRNMQVA